MLPFNYMYNVNDVNGTLIFNTNLVVRSRKRFLTNQWCCRFPEYYWSGFTNVQTHWFITLTSMRRWFKTAIVYGQQDWTIQRILLRLRTHLALQDVHLLSKYSSTSLDVLNFVLQVQLDRVLFFKRSVLNINCYNSYPRFFDTLRKFPLQRGINSWN